MIEEMWTLSAGVRLHRFAGVVSNTYILENRRRGQTFLIDCGMPSDFDALVAVLAAIPEPAGVFCTHFHIDHIGGWFTLKKRWPALFIAFSEAARRRVTGSQRLPLPSFSDIRDVLLPCMRAFGYAPKIRDVLCGRLYGTPFHKGFPAERVRFFRQGDPPVDGFEILATPGHTVDSVSFYHQPSGLLICGDTFLWLDGRLQVNPFVEDAESQRRTVEGLGRLADRLMLCPGHGRNHSVSPNVLMVDGAYVKENEVPSHSNWNKAVFNAPENIHPARIDCHNQCSFLRGNHDRLSFSIPVRAGGGFNRLSVADNGIHRNKRF